MLRNWNMQKPNTMRGKKITLLLSFVLFTLLGVQAQIGDNEFKGGGASLKQYVKIAKEAFENKDYYTAMVRYKQATEISPNNLDLKYAHAESARLLNAYTVAEMSYTEVIEARGENQYPLAELWLAEVKQNLDKYQEGIALFDSFLEAQTGNESIKTYYIQRAKKGRMDCEWARVKSLEPQDIQIIHLGNEVNSEYNEIAPFLKGDTLFLSSTRFRNEEENNGDARLYTRMMASVDGGDSFELTEHKVNEPGRHAANVAFSDDYKRMYYTLCDYVGESAQIRCAIYFKELLADGVWSSAIKLPDHINPVNASSTHPSISYDKSEGSEVLYFASDMEGGKGKMDIWMSKIAEDGTVGEPVNMEQINSEENEVTPFFHEQSQTLYFSSDGLQGFGAYDIYEMTKKDGAWKDPENMGAPINSSLNDVYFSLNQDGSMAVMSSNRKGSIYIDPKDEICCNDVYKFEFNTQVEVLVSTFEGLTKEELAGVTVTVYEVGDDGELIEIEMLTNLDDNEFPFFLERGKKYIIEGKKDGYVVAKEELFIPEDAPDQILQDLYLDPITVDLKVLVYDLDSGLPLNGVTVQIVEISEDGSEKIVQEQLNEVGNDFQFPLDRDKKYVIRAKKPAYKPLDDLELNTFDITKSETFLAELQLKRTGFLDYLPLAIYFDNDYPSPDSRSKTTEDGYEDLIDAYYARKEEYKLLFTDPMTQEEAFLTAQRYESFFEREVKQGYEDLREFANALLSFLDNGNQVRIALKGFASPRSTDSYNYNLSARRINSIENFFRSYSGGLLLKYLEDGRFAIEREPIGEEQAPNFVIDKIQDERNSIFSLGASLERRVEIIEAEIILGETDGSQFEIKGEGER